MSAEPSGLHKVLKDPTRSKLIILLNEKGSLSYTELLDFSEVGSTGRLNYHLKVLGDLLAKNDSGQYMLTEKGKLAVQLLKELSTENNRQIGSNKFSPKNLIWIGVSNGLFLFIMAYFYFNYNIPSYWLLTSLMFFAASIFAMIAFAKLPANIQKYSPQKRRNGTKYGFIGLGAGVGMFGGILGGCLILVAAIRSLRLAGVPTVFLGFTQWVIISAVIGVIIGGLLGYIIFGKSRYSKISYY